MPSTVLAAPCVLSPHHPPPPPTHPPHTTPSCINTFWCTRTRWGRNVSRKKQCSPTARGIAIGKTCIQCARNIPPTVRALVWRFHREYWLDASHTCSAFKVLDGHTHTRNADCIERNTRLRQRSSQPILGGWCYFGVYVECGYGQINGRTHGCMTLPDQQTKSATQKCAHRVSQSMPKCLSPDVRLHRCRECIIHRCVYATNTYIHKWYTFHVATILVLHTYKYISIYIYLHGVAMVSWYALPSA